MPSKFKRRGTPGRPYSDAVIKEALRLIAQKKKSPRSKDLTYRSIANRLGIHSHRTVVYWAHKNMTAKERHKRIRNRGWKRLLSNEEERIAAGYVILCSINSLSSSSVNLRLFLREAFGMRAKPSWISSFAQRNHLSYRRPQRRTFNHPLGSVEEKMVKFLEEIRTLNKLPHQLKVLDKTYFQSQSISGRQLTMAGRCVYLI